jgi:hypothetical protein
MLNVAEEFRSVLAEEGLNRSELMKKVALLFAALFMAAAAMVFSGAPASAASVGGVAAQTEAATDSNVQDVYWHRHWRSHHRWGSGHWHGQWRSHHRWGSGHWRHHRRYRW